MTRCHILWTPEASQGVYASQDPRRSEGGRQGWQGSGVVMLRGWLEDEQSFEEADRYAPSREGGRDDADRWKRMR